MTIELIRVLYSQAEFAMASILSNVYLTTVFTQGEKLISDARDFIVAASTAAAIVGVGIGAFLWKFSGGDHHKVDTGKKAVFYSLAGWAAVNGMTLILSTIGRYTTA